MIFITINNKELYLKQNVTIYNAALQLNVQIPTFCYNEKESIAGNCRMCLVEVKGMPKLVASCAFNTSEGMDINTQSIVVKKAREYILEYLLVNHPLDCPICDQGGECDLQDITMVYGRDKGRFYYDKRSVSDVSLGLLVTTSFNRCIQCTKCVRFLDEIANYMKLGMVGRSKSSMIDKFLDKKENFQHNLVSNIVDICPVGALTSKVYNFKGRNWELQRVESIDIFDSLGSSVYIETRELNIVRILPHVNFLLNEEWLSDKTRYNFDGFFFNRIDNPSFNIKQSYLFFYKNLRFVLKKNRLRNISWNFLFNLYKEDILISKNLSDISIVFGNESAVNSLVILKEFSHLINASGFYPQNYSINNKLVFDNYLFCDISSIEVADFILIVGSNISLEVNLLSVRLRKALQNGSRIYTIGSNVDFLVGAQKISNTLFTFFQILQGKHYLCTDLLLAKKPLILLSDDRNLSVDLFSSHFLFPFMFSLSSFIGCVASKEIGYYNYSINNKLYYFFQCEDISVCNSNYIIYQGTHFDFTYKKSDLIVPYNLFMEEDFYYFTLVNVLKKTNLLNLSTISDFGLYSSFNFIKLLIRTFNSDFLLSFDSLLLLYSLKFNIGGSFFSYNKNKNDFNILFNLKDFGFNFDLFSNFYSSDSISRNSLIMSKLSLKNNFLI